MSSEIEYGFACTVVPWTEAVLKRLIIVGSVRLLLPNFELTDYSILVSEEMQQIAYCYWQEKQLRRQNPILRYPIMRIHRFFGENSICTKESGSSKVQRELGSNF